MPAVMAIAPTWPTSPMHKDPLTVDREDNDRDAGVLDVLLQPLGDVGASCMGVIPAAWQIAEQNEGDPAVGTDGNRAGEGRLLPDRDLERVLGAQ